MYFLLRDLLVGNRLAVKRMRKDGELPRAGRNRKEIPEKDLREAKERMENGFMTAQQAADALGVSRATLFRKLKQLD